MRIMRRIELPVRRYIPQWMVMLTMFMILVNIVLVNGAYLGSSIDVSGALGTTSEDITMAFYACSIGMVVANPLVQKVRQIMTTKTLLLTDIALQCLFSMICAGTYHMEVMIICCFIIGLLKTFLLLEFIILMTPLFTPGNVRSESYSWFYPLVFGGGQFSIPLTAWIAYNYKWQYTYYFVIILLLVTMSMIIVCFRDARSPKIAHIKEINFRSIFFVSISYLVLVYSIVYGKILDWFNSDLIVSFVSGGVGILSIFIYHQCTSKKPYISFRPLRNLKSIVGYIFMFICVFFNSDTSIVNNYITYALHLDNIHANALVLWTVPGYILAGIIGFWWFRLQKWRFRYLVSVAFWMYAIYFIILYFGVSPVSRYESLFIPTVFKGTAFMLLVIAFGVYAAEDIESPYLVSNTFFMISTRSVFAPVISMALFSNYLYNMQINSMMKLSEYYTNVDTNAHGKQIESLVQFIQDQSMLIGIKNAIGYLTISSIVLAVITIFIPFHKTLSIPALKAGQDMA